MQTSKTKVRPSSKKNSLSPQTINQHQPYKSELPPFLTKFIGQITKLDQFQVLSYTKLIQPLQELIPEPDEARKYIWLFIDPIADKHIISKQANTNVQGPVDNTVSEKFRFEMAHQYSDQVLSFSCSNILATKISESMHQYISKTQAVSLDQLILRSQANIYTEPLQLQRDLRRVFTWCLIYRAKSLKAFQYLSKLYEQFILLLARQEFFSKFEEIKQSDLKRLMGQQLDFKIDLSKWPIIPETFREYEEIQEYVPTPSNRAAIIKNRLRSEKEPVECPVNCVCLADNLEQGEYFCKFSLINGWETTCPNRARKVECEHQNKADQQKCRNSEIKRHKRKKCKGKLGVSQAEAQIEERLTWGMDLFSRNVIYRLLPAFDIEGKSRICNQERKNNFIEKTLSKALNLLGNKGFSLILALRYIKQHSEKHFTQSKKQVSGLSSQIAQSESKQKAEKYQAAVEAQDSSLPQISFSQKDFQYADLLLKNCEIAQDKSAFRTHTKGKGAICIDQKGITQGSFITEYFGELYQLWRWFDREDLIKQVMKSKKLKNYMPEFYNIALQKHPDQPLGCDILMVDPSTKGNFSSRFSHSCDPNCGTVITVSNGRYFVGMYAFKDIAYGEELTFDYCSMTESSFQHFNSICLCGMKSCRGYYLQLSNTKLFDNLMDNKHCLFTRNSALLSEIGNNKEKDENYKICFKYNIKFGILQRCPNWLIRWIAQVLRFIQIQGQAYRKRLIDSWRNHYPWENATSQQEKQQNIQTYSLISRQQLESIRFQNLIASVDKIAFFMQNNSTKWHQPPIYIQPNSKVFDFLVKNPDSVLNQLQEILVKHEQKELAQIIQKFLRQIKKAENKITRLSMFRLCCLVISHRLLFIKNQAFNTQFLSDIIYFYAFTHTYFSLTQYAPFEAEEIVVSCNQILGKPSDPTQKKERSCKKYASPFVWGQIASWFNPNVVKSQVSSINGKRGVLSYPQLRSVTKSEYPYQKQNRANFLRTLVQKPANGWPGSFGLSFESPYKIYGNILFESVHSKKRLKGIFKETTLLQVCVQSVNLPFSQKLPIFKEVERFLGGLPTDNHIYRLAELAGDVQIRHPFHILQGGAPKKMVKKDQ